MFGFKTKKRDWELLVATVANHGDSFLEARRIFLEIHELIVELQVRIKKLENKKKRTE